MRLVRWGLVGWCVGLGIALGPVPATLAQTVPAGPTAPAAAASVPAAVLERPVRFARAATVPLAQGLAELSRQSGVPISYSSSRIGAARRCQLRAGAARPLGQVLDELLGANALAAGLVGGQLVLWPAAEKPPLGAVKLRPWVAVVAPAAPVERAAPAAGTAAAPPAAPAARGAGAPPVAPATTAAATAAAANPERQKKAVSGPKRPTDDRRPAPLSTYPAGRGLAATSSLNSSPKPASGPPKSATAPNASPPLSSSAGAAGTAITNPARRPLHGAAEARSTSSKAPGNFFNKSLSKKLLVAAPGRRPPVAASPSKALGELKKSLSTRNSAAAQNAVYGLPDSLAGRPVLVRLPVETAPETRPPAAVAAVVVPPAPARLPLRRRRAQVSLLPPLSSGRLANGRTVNGLSLNVLAGYAAGVRAVELGGLLNVVRDSVRGGQAAGLLNVVGTDVRGVQLAGLGNVGGGGVRGLQAAGAFNLARDDVRGVQLAGLLNVVGGAAQARSRAGQPTRVRRWLGLPRLLATDGLARLPAAPSASQPGVLVQLAGLANLTGTDVRGLQSAPLLNVARRVRGAQFGLVNVARAVRGSQIGLINIADSLTGAPIGFINIVRRGGYRRGEVWASETLPLNAVFKLGVPRFYTIFGAAAEPFGSRVAWAAGFGVGTAGRPHGRFTLSLDLMQWTLAGTTSDPDAAQIDSRQLTQLRPALAWQIERDGHLQLIVAPTFNLAIAWQNDGQPNWEFGSNQWLWIETAGPQSQTRLWPGLQVGLRF